MRTPRQYYCHSFLKEQPDLNWRNPEVQEAMLDVMRFWLGKGVDGFRVDALWHVIKDEQFRDNPLDPEYVEGEMSPYCRLVPAYSGGQPELHEIVALMRRVTQEFPERVLIGEMYLPVEELVRYYGRDGDSGIHLPYNFQLIVLPWRAMDIFAGINEYEASLPAFAWPNWVLGNHDKPRVASRVGPDQAKIAALLLLTLRGTPTMYYGDEIGMEDVNVPAGARPATRWPRPFPGSGWAATRSGRRCSGAPSRTRDSRRASRGCPSPRITSRRTWRSRSRTTTRCWRSTGSCWSCGRRSRPCRSAATCPPDRRRTCSPSSASTRRRRC